ncbi:MAG: DUF1778 domain-containing protein [Armatimonadetes bacterium]|nr:DUF1778 domain-containing protein [Armatimonadota bacterium]
MDRARCLEPAEFTTSDNLALLSDGDVVHHGRGKDRSFFHGSSTTNRLEWRRERTAARRRVVCQVDTQRMRGYQAFEKEMAVATDAGANPRLAFRMKRELKARVEEAASLMGLTVTDFVVSTLSQRASEVLERQNNLTLSDRDRDRFLEALDRQGQPVPCLLRLLESRRQRLGE